jgi:hypothetical protein
MNLFRSFKRSTGAAMLAATILATSQFAAPTPANAAVFVSVAIAPPPIPVYEQPLCPGEGYIWTPGYWAWNGEGYEWVEGAWVVAPYVGALWTPGYWGYSGGYFWHAGYWGRSIGYYGGINYGFGYFGTGFYGGYWNGGRFFYNSAYNHLNVTHIHNVYVNRVNGFDGRPGGAAFTSRPGLAVGNHGSNVQTAAFGSRNGFSGNPGIQNNPTHGFATNAPQQVQNQGALQHGNLQQPSYNQATASRGSFTASPRPSQPPPTAQPNARPNAPAPAPRYSGSAHGGSERAGHR